MKISVLMSVYRKEKPEYLEKSLDSILAQTRLPDEILMVEDGPLTPELYAVLSAYEKNPLLKRLPLSENVGLGKALNAGIAACVGELIARMDTDDIALPERLERQEAEFIADPTLDLCGSHSLEFDGDISNVVSKKLVPVSHEEIKRYARKRNPFNHPTVMFKKMAVEAVGSYRHAHLFEDYYLWARMLANGCKTKNVDDALLYFRTGSDMFKRRGGFSYLKSAVSIKWKLYRMGVSGFFDFLTSAGVHAVVSLMPNRLRAYVYQRFLRKDGKN